MQDYYRFLALADELRQQAEGLRGKQRKEVLNEVETFQKVARRIKRLIDSGYPWDPPADYEPQ